MPETALLDLKDLKFKVTKIVKLRKTSVSINNKQSWYHNWKSSLSGWCCPCCFVIIKAHFCQLSRFISCLCCNLYTASESKIGNIEFALLFSFCNILPVRKEFWSCLDALGISMSQSETGIWWFDQPGVFTRRCPHSSQFGIGIVTLTLNFKMKSKRVFVQLFSNTARKETRLLFY